MGGAVVGSVLSPLPWKLLDDAAIWTQNWSMIARAPRGPVSHKYTTCQLCPIGCGMRARLVGTSFVSAWPVAGHPAAAGTLCPLGLAAAQMRYHPSRVRGVARRDRTGADPAWRIVDADATTGELGQRLAACRSRGAAENIAIVDLRPGRAMSRLYREFLARQGGGLYVTAPDAWQASATAFAGLATVAALAPTPDPARARTVLNFGAPLTAGWRGHDITPHAAGGPLLIQVDPAATTTATRADRWLPARPGTEAPVALALAHVLVFEALASDARVNALADMPHASSPHGNGTSLRAALAEFAPERVAEISGLTPAQLRDTAHALAAGRPSLVLGVGDAGGGPLGAEEEAAIWNLNLLLGAVGPDGALGVRPADTALFEEPAGPAARSLSDIPDGSLDVLLVDGSFPGAPMSAELLRRKLRGPDGLLVALSPYAGGAAGTPADLVLPTFAPGEWVDDVPAPALSARASYAWATAVAVPAPFALHPAEWLARLEAASGLVVPAEGGKAGHEAELKRRAGVLQSRGSGQVFDPADGNTTDVAAMNDPEMLAGALARGAHWSDKATLAIADGDLRPLGTDGDMATRWRSLADGRVESARTAGSAGSLVLMAGGGLAPAAGAITAPVLNKLYRESGLQPGSRQLAVSATTARARGLQEGAAALLTTPHGRRRVRIRLDNSLPPDVARLAAGPDPSDMGDPAASPDDRTDIPDLCGAAERPVWRLVRADLQEAHDGNA
jgi:hypothetical protein